MLQGAGVAKGLPQQETFTQPVATPEFAHDLSTAASSQKNRQDFAVIKHPEQLLGALRQRIETKPETPLGLIQTIHMDTLLSAAGDAAPVYRGQVHPEIMRFARQIRNKGATALYPIGTFESGAYSELMISYFAATWPQPGPKDPNWRPWVGASVFSIDNYAPNLRIGGRESLKILVQALESQTNLTVLPCLVTNTIGIGGLLARSGLDYISDYPREMRHSDEVKFFSDLCKNTERHGAKQIWKNHLTRGSNSSSPGEHNLEIIEFRVPGQHNRMHRLFHYDYQGTHGHKHKVFSVFDPTAGFLPFCWIIDQPPGSDQAKLHLKKLGSQSPNNPYVNPKDVWGDTLQLKVSGASAEDRAKTIAWLAQQYGNAVGGIFKYARADMAHLPDGQFWKDFQRCLANATRPHKHPSFIAEAYCGTHGHLAEAGLNPYAKYILDWLANRESEVVHDYLFSSGGAIFLRHCVGFTANHDDKACGSRPKQVADFAAMLAMPFGKILVAQGQLDGISEFRFSADMHAPHHDFKELFVQPRWNSRKQDRNNVDRFSTCMRRLGRLAELPVFRNPRSATYPAVFEAFQDQHTKQLPGVLHFTRLYTAPCGRTDRAILIADYYPGMRKEPLVLLIRESFHLPSDLDLNRYALVSLLNGRVYEATERHRLELEHSGAAFDTEVTLLMLVPRKKADQLLLTGGTDRPF